MQLEDWARTTPGRDYETFRAWLYALDVFIPLDALGQEKTWAPSASRGWWGEVGHRLRWLVQMSGLGDYRHRRGLGHRVDRSAGLTFRALRVM